MTCSSDLKFSKLGMGKSYVRERDCGPGSVVSTATCYGLDGPGIESQWGRDFPHLYRPWGPLSLLYWVFPRGKEWPGRDADPSSPSSAMVMKE